MLKRGRARSNQRLFWKGTLLLFIPCIFGILLGVAFKVGTSKLNVACQLSEPTMGLKITGDSSLGNIRKTGLIIEAEGIDDAPIVPHGVSQKKQLKGLPKKAEREKYARTELGIKDKLFIGVLASRDTINGLSVALNYSLSSFANKIVFFMEAHGPDLPRDMKIVSFTDVSSHLKPIHMLEYVAKNYKDMFDFYYFVSDATYVRGDRLRKLVDSLSIANPSVIGFPTTHQKLTYCDVDAGFVISGIFLEEIKSHLPQCYVKALTDDPSLTLGQCISYVHGTSCKSKIQGMAYHHHRSKDFAFSDITSLQYKAIFNKAISIYKLSSAEEHYRLHRYFVDIRMNETKTHINELKREIARVSPQTTDESAHNFHWPPGSNPAFSDVKSRYDVINWVCFTETQIFAEDERSSVEELTGLNKADVTAVLGQAMQYVRQKHGARRYNLRQLVFGYRKFDPTRGMDYLLDLELDDTQHNTVVVKRIHVMRPLSKVEIIPMPSTSQTAMINMVLKVTHDEVGGVASFLDSFSHSCLDAGENATLLIIFVADSSTENVYDDTFSVLKSMISYYEQKYKSSANIAWSTLRSKNPTDVEVVQLASRKLSPHSLVLLCTVGMELEAEFLSRVRMNTIAGWQAYFPIAFWQYRPNLIYDQKPFPSRVEVTSSNGHFDKYIFDHASFYLTDFEAAKKLDNNRKLDLIALFLKYKKLHIFRTVEPTLRLRYKERQCQLDSGRDATEACRKSRLTSLAEPIQLAKLVLTDAERTGSK